MNNKEIPILLDILRFLKEEHVGVGVKAFKSKEERGKLSFWELVIDDYDVYRSEDFAASREAIRLLNPELKLLFLYLKEDKQKRFNHSIRLR